MRPLSTGAVRLFSLIAANAAKTGYMHLKVLIHLAEVSRSEVEVALIELMAQDYVTYNIDTQHIYLVRQRNEKRHHRFLS